MRVANNNDVWIAACGGTEQPFTTRTGRRLHYLWNRTTGEHAYYDCDQDLILDNHDAFIALGMVEVPPLEEVG